MIIHIMYNSSNIFYFQKKIICEKPKIVKFLRIFFAELQQNP